MTLQKALGCAIVVLIACTVACSIAAWLSISAGYVVGTPEFGAAQGAAVPIALAVTALLYLFEKDW